LLKDDLEQSDEYFPCRALAEKDRNLHIVAWVWSSIEVRCLRVFVDTAVCFEFESPEGSSLEL
jgi:hypothetical protein